MAWLLIQPTDYPDAVFLKGYDTPPGSVRDSIALSFGIGSRGSGVAWHYHGPGYAEVLHGVKRWFLTPPEIKPPGWNEKHTTLHWLATVGVKRGVMEVDLRPGDVLWFPDRWYHATLNVADYTCFVSSFVDVGVMRGRGRATTLQPVGLIGGGDL